MNPINIYRERVSKTSLSPYLSYATGWTMRIWREEPLSKFTPGKYEPGRTRLDDDIYGIIQRFVQMPVAPLEIAEAVLALDRVNAVEITDLAGFGEVLYKDWP